MANPSGDVLAKRNSLIKKTLCWIWCLIPFVGAGVRAEEPAATNLPLTRVVLFSSGVGFFEHAGMVDGNAQVQLQFNVEDINDLLKSMVVQDVDGGQISTVGYGSKDPITKTLKSFAIDLTEKPTLAQLLDQIRGERVELEAPNKLSGIILGTEKRKQKVGESEVIEIDVLNVLTDTGLRAVNLDTVGSIKLANEKLDAELRKALAVLASSHDLDKKSVTLEFRGEGQRRVRATSRKPPSGRPATAWCSRTTSRRCCRAGPLWRTRRRRTGPVLG